MQCLSSSSEYGGARISSTAHDVTALKECIFPPLVGYRIVDPQGAFITLSVTSLANLAAKSNVDS